VIWETLAPVGPRVPATEWSWAPGRPPAGPGPVDVRPRPVVRDRCPGRERRRRQAVTIQPPEHEPPDPADETSPAPTPEDRPTRRRPPVSRRRQVRNRILVLSSLCMAAAIVVLALLPTDYLAISPRAAEPVSPHLTITGDGVEVYEPTGQILYLTVSISSRTLRRVEWVQAKLDDDVTLIHEKAYTGGKPRDEVRQQGQTQIADSKLIAELVAFQHLGLPYRETGTGAIVQQVNDKYPVKDFLQPGDIITKIDGEQIEIAEDIGDEVQPREPGDTIDVTFERDGQMRTATIPLSETTNADGTTRTVLGVTPVTRGYQLVLDPYDIAIDTGSVGGPSAGLAFTLTLIDELTPGELTGGQIVAVTGQINADGSVSPVGGVKQKAIAAHRKDAVAMIVPIDEEAEARANADGMPIYGVKDLAGALAVLQELGGVEAAVPDADAVAVAAPTTTTITPTT
jgi:Lon-like protease